MSEKDILNLIDEVLSKSEYESKDGHKVIVSDKSVILFQIAGKLKVLFDESDLSKDF